MELLFELFGYFICLAPFGLGFIGIIISIIGLFWVPGKSKDIPTKNKVTLDKQKEI